MDVLKNELIYPIWYNYCDENRITISKSKTESAIDNRIRNSILDWREDRMFLFLD